ncbi:hypothetical protein [Kyrpidia tusciae]|uniref:Lipoprotein n=1 Tax=Kyrpidia tusciae (strain DSM 2912 / NBRC 15312 / T2) TaxID=562970 RepID=D5WRT4_KYRT2|nr:hypothetical protein [Kyrpidia tusciae]ADG06886.1 hypothetical protein Btus_2209 [Kyrpidia tusciae DSM 2912]
MKMVPTIASIFVLLVTGCFDSAAVKNESAQSTAQPSSFTEEKAIAKVNCVLGTAFPDKPGTVQCKVGAGGPPGRTVPATLQTKVQKDGPSSYLVTFIEQWSAQDFNSGGNTNKSTLEHYWTFKVTPNGSALLSQGGDFPPQAAL